MLGELLAAKMRQEEGYHAGMESYLAAPPSSLTEAPGAQPYPSRDSLHER